MFQKGAILMMDFIVLGLIPGTHIQVTFAWFLFGALIALLYINHRIKKAASASGMSSQAEQLKLL